MAGQHLHGEKDRRVRQLLAFASDLEVGLPAAATSRTPGTLLNSTENQVSTFPGNLGSTARSRCDEIDDTGTRIWNLCTRLRRNHDPEKPEDGPAILVAARVFAFLLLNCAHENGKSTNEDTLRLMRVGIKAAKNSFDRKDAHLCLKVLEKVARYEEILRRHQPNDTQDKEECARLCAEYFVLRTALAAYMKQFDMAEHMYTSATTSLPDFDPYTAESLADVLYEMGKDLMQSLQFQMAAKWLERAYEILSSQELDKLSFDASELRASITQSYVKALLALQDTDSIQKARSLVNLLEDEFGDKLVVLLLKLEMLSVITTETFDSASYSDILQRMIRSAVLSDSNFKMIMFHIRKLSMKSPSLACKALEDIMRLRLLKEDKSDHLEKVLVTRVAISSSQTDDPDSLSSLNGFFTMIATNVRQPVSGDATLAAHTLLWKKIESNYAQARYDVAASWCQLAMHQIFEKSGEHNMTRISRKLLLCALGKGEISSAREIFASMSASAQNEPMTRFLMFKIALRSEEVELAAECLQIVSSQSGNDPKLLYACCLDAQEVGNRVMTLAALQLTLEKHDYSTPGSIHLPSLLRITIGLTERLLEESKAVDHSPPVEGTVDKLCTLFERAVNSLQKSFSGPQRSDQLWTIAELNWYSKNAYNLAIKHMSHWAPCFLLRMLTCCISFIDHYTRDVNEQNANDLSFRKLFCLFCASTAQVAMSRGEDNIEQRLQGYLVLRNHVKSFDDLLQTMIKTLPEAEALDLNAKFSILLMYDFEASCQLKAWDDLGSIILNTADCNDIRIFELMADIILASGAPTLVMINTLQKIINRAWTLESLDSKRLARYMRCLFQIAMSDNVGVAEQLLDQIQEHAEQTHEKEGAYPDEELDWVATKAFNHAVDFYCSGEDEACKNWASKALNIAHFCHDDGRLETLLQTKWAGLKFDS